VPRVPPISPHRLGHDIKGRQYKPGDVTEETIEDVASLDAQSGNCSGSSGEYSSGEAQSGAAMHEIAAASRSVQPAGNLCSGAPRGNARSSRPEEGLQLNIVVNSFKDQTAQHCSNSVGAVFFSIRRLGFTRPPPSAKSSS